MLLLLWLPYSIAAIHPKGCERVIYLSTYLVVNCTNDTFLTSANFLDLVLVLLGGSIPIPLSFPLSLSLMTFRLMRPMSHPNKSNVFSFLLFSPFAISRGGGRARLG